MAIREASSLDSIIAEAREMQANGQYINGTVFHTLVAEIERLRNTNATDKVWREQESRMGLTQLVEAKHRFLKNWKRTFAGYLAESFERELDYLLHLAAREAVAPIVKQYTELLLANASPDLRPAPMYVVKTTET